MHYYSGGLESPPLFLREAKISAIEYFPTPFSYSRAVAAGGYVFLGLHRGSGDEFTAQFHGTIANLKKTLAEFVPTLANLVKVNV